MTSQQITATLNRKFRTMELTVEEFRVQHKMPFSKEYMCQFLFSAKYRGRAKTFEWTAKHAATLLAVAWALQVPDDKIKQMLISIGDDLYHRILTGDRI